MTALTDWAKRSMQGRPTEATITRKVIRAMKDAGKPITVVFDGGERVAVDGTTTQGLSRARGTGRRRFGVATCVTCALLWASVTFRGECAGRVGSVLGSTLPVSKNSRRST